MLQHLVGVDDVEGPAEPVDVEVVHVTDHDRRVGDALPVELGSGERCRLVVDLEGDDLRAPAAARSAVMVPGPEPTSSRR